MCVPSGLSPKIGATYSPGPDAGGSVEVSLSSTMPVMSAFLQFLDRILGGIRRRQASLVVKIRRYLSIEQQHRLAVVVDIEQLRRQRVAAVVSLTLLRIEMNSHRQKLSSERASLRPGRRG